MVLMIYVIFVWILIIGISLLRKTLTKLENVYLFLILSILIINTFTIVSFNFKLIKETTDHEKAMAFIVYRDVVLPLLLIFFVTLLVQYSRTLKSKLLIFLGTLLLMTSVEILGKTWGLFTYVKWNLFLSMLVFIGFQLITYLFLSLFSSLRNKGEVI